MLAEVHRIDDAKNLMDTASAAKHYAQKHKLGKEAVGYAKEIEIRAEILLGEFLAKMRKNKGGEPLKYLEGRGINPTTLTEIGINYNLSSEAQRLALLPEKEKEKIVKGKKSKQSTLREQKRQDDEIAIKNKTFPVITGKFKTILIDPPWDYGNLSLAGRGYPEYAPMSLEKLRELNIDQYAENNSHLYLWCTNNFLYEALKLGEIWGFSYKTVLTWVKPSIGLGSYFRNNTEQLLFFVKGQLSTRTANTPTHFAATRGKHSEKPEISYKIIEKNSYPSFLELFSRKERKNWTVWGNLDV